MAGVCTHHDHNMDLEGAGRHRLVELVILVGAGQNNKQSGCQAVDK